MVTCTPTNWSDAIGNTCQDYSDKRYCKIDGIYGDGWATDNGTFDNWRSNGFTAWNCINCGCISGLNHDICITTFMFIRLIVSHQCWLYLSSLYLRQTGRILINNKTRKCKNTANTAVHCCHVKCYTIIILFSEQSAWIFTNWF